MFGMDTTILAFIGLATLAAGGVVYAFMFDRVSNEVQQERRIKSVHSRKEETRAKAVNRIADATKRKKSVQDSLKELEAKQKERSKSGIGLKRQMQQAGLKINIRQFAMISIATAILAVIAAYMFGAPPLGALAAGVVCGLGLPRWVVARIHKRRMNKFLEEFPNAVDVIVRGVRAGLPLNDCLNIIAREAKDPVASEFRRIVETQQMGIPLSEAVTRLYDNIPLTEANFFGIVIAIQQSAGGNLSEALGNLSNVLRDRKKMKHKITAMSTEAKTSAGIIGALPFLVATLVYLTTPEYIKILFTHPTGNIVLVCSGIWMSMGIMVMKKMINFDF